MVILNTLFNMNKLLNLLQLISNEWIWIQLYGVGWKWG